MNFHPDDIFLIKNTLLKQLNIKCSDADAYSALTWSKGDIIAAIVHIETYYND